MRSIRQLFRQPIKSLSGIVLVALAVAILCVCVGQSAAAANMRTSMEDSYTTVALPTNKYLTGSWPQDALDWVKQAVAENQDIILADSHSGLASAYIQELHPDNYTKYVVSDTTYNPDNYVLMADKAAPYTNVMMELTLTSYDVTYFGGDIEVVNSGVTELPEESDGAVPVTLRGTVERVIGLEQGYADPTGFEAIVTMKFPDWGSWKEAEAQFVIGQRYLTYGVNYIDRDWVLRSRVASGDGILPSYEFGNSFPGFCIDHLDPDELIYIDSNQWNVAYYIYTFTDAEGNRKERVVNFSQNDLDYYFNKISFDLMDYSEFSGKEKYKNPTIVKLDGTAEEFLASEEGAFWQEALDALEVNNQCFPVIGVDNLMYIGEFAKQDAMIVEGRDFTQEELDSGAKVCVISKYLAEQNGLSVGDTLTTRFYIHDTDYLWQDFISENEGVINPTAYYFTAATEFAGEAEIYTIVGLYDQTSIWTTSAVNLYAMTPNTIFAPKTSVTGDMDYSEMGMFRSLEIRNGSIEAFKQLQRESGYASLFVCYDQSYTELSEKLYSYETIADQALKVGLVVYCVVLLLYFVLFPSQQGKTISIMASFGATRKEKLQHVNLSGLGILIPGTVIGLTAGILMRQKVIDALTKSADVVLPLEMDVDGLVLIAAAQLLLAAVLTLVISVPMTRSKSLMKRRGLTESIRQLRKVPLNTWVVTGFAVIVALVLCGLHASNEAEIENYEVTRKEIPITVTVMDRYGDSSENLDLEPWVANVLSGFYDWGLSDYLTDVRIGFDLPIALINQEGTDRRLRGIMSVNAAPELLPITNSSISWNEGFDESIFEGDGMVCIVPEGYAADFNPSTEEQELHLIFDSGIGIYECTLTVVGTYTSTQNVTHIYCPYKVADTARARIQTVARLDSASATLKNNDDLEKFRLIASRFFSDPSFEAAPDGKFNYSLMIDTEALDKAEAVLNNSITINRISTYLVFILSAGAGFFLGFLMIRNRKREIILMRTLGKPNSSIYLDFAAEQMLRLILGAAIGGAVFRWEPLSRLGSFVAVYFVGLSAALILFLNSKLLTNIKEEE